MHAGGPIRAEPTVRRAIAVHFAGEPHRATARLELEYPRLSVAPAHRTWTVAYCFVALLHFPALSRSNRDIRASVSAMYCRSIGRMVRSGDATTMGLNR